MSFLVFFYLEFYLFILKFSLFVVFHNYLFLVLFNFDFKF